MKRKTLTAMTLDDDTQQKTSYLNRPQAVRMATKLLSGAAMLGAFALSTVASSDQLLAETPCDAYVPSCGEGICDCGKCNQPAPSCGCGKCGRSKSPHRNPLYQSLDTVAGGIEKLFGLDRSSKSACDSGCDDSCDSGEWMMSEQPFSHSIPQPIPVAPYPAKPLPRAAAPLVNPHATSPPMVTPPLPSVPSMENDWDQPKKAPPQAVSPQTPPAPDFKSSPRSAPPKPAPPKPEPIQREPEVSQPRIVPAPPEPSKVTTPEMSPQMPIPELGTDPPGSDGNDAAPSKSLDFPGLPEAPPVKPAPKNEDSIFDALDDPFIEDAARLRQPYQPIRRARNGSSAKPTRTSSLIKPTNGNQVVGSGLRTARVVAPLRPVSHQEPIEARPRVNNKRVLAPYRASR